MTLVTDTAVGLEPADIKRLGNAFCHAKLLLTAGEIGLFVDLEANPDSTAADLGERLELHPRGRQDFLDALVVLGLLTKVDGRYNNSAVTSQHLIPGGDTYMGGFLNRSNRILYPAWGNLTDALRTGEPQVPSAQEGEFERMLSQPQQQAQYLRMMDSVNSLVAPLLAEAFDFASYQDLVDVGGARGNLASNLLLAHPHLSASVFDLPVMAGPLAEHTATKNLPSPITFHGGNFFVDPLPSGDVLIIGHVLHNWAPEERQLLVKKAFEALRPGGALLVYDAMLSDEPTDLARILVSLNMLLVTRGGSEYPASECERWLTNAGFVDVDQRPLGTTDTLVVGHKPVANS